jgi:hypothetical protein
MDAHESTSKFLKNRWRAKVFPKEEPVKKPEPNFQLDDDVNAFLKPSTDKAHAHKETASSAFLAGANKPRIDVARAQRWPAASAVIASAGNKTPGTGGLKTGTRKKGLSVSFVRTTPDIIGHGGDECEEPSIAVSNRKKSTSLSSPTKVPVQTHQDDLSLGMRTSASFHNEESANAEAERRGIVTRRLTSHGELSPPLRQKMELGSINAHATPPPVPPRGLGAMGLGERPKPLQRAPTGFDPSEIQSPVGTGRKQSVDSAYSYESSENLSPVVSRQAPSLAPPAEEEEEEYFKPKPLQRQPTTWSEHAPDSDDEPPPPPPPSSRPTVPRIPTMDLKDSASSPLETTMNKFLESESENPGSFSARTLQKMKADEGRALHEASLRAQTGSKRDSGSSDSSFGPGSGQSNAFQVGTPPQNFVIPLAGKTPPRFLMRDQSPPSPRSARHSLDSEDPHRSHAHGPSPVRAPLPPGTHPLDTSARPPSAASSQHTLPSAASRAPRSPPASDPFPATSTAQTSSTTQRPPISATSTASHWPSANSNTEPFSAVSQSSILPTPPQFEKANYTEPSQDQPPPVPPHIQSPKLSSPVHRRPVLDEGTPSQRQLPASSLARSNTKVQGEVALADFSDRVENMKGIFTLTAQLGGPIFEHTPMEWLRVAMWWFLKGRAGMENQIRNRLKEPQPERLTQPHVDLAKVWWIVTELVQTHPTLQKYSNVKPNDQAKSAREGGDVTSAEVYDVRDVIHSALKMLLGSMKRNGSMPPTQALIQGQDQSIWVEYPKFAPDARMIISGSVSKSKRVLASGQHRYNPANYMPLGDTKDDFCYFRMFVTVSVSTDDPETDRKPLPAVISVLRPREEYTVKLSICSQNELVSIVVGSSPDAGPSWRDVVWKSKVRGFSVQLLHNFTLNVEMSEQDFRSLWAIVDHTNRVEGTLLERIDEQLCVNIDLRDTKYKDSSNQGAFPPEGVKGCKLMLFEKFERSSEGTGKRKLHRGYRLVLVTPPSNRTLSYVSHALGNQEPTNFEYTTDPATNIPGMTLRLKDETPDKKPKLCTMYLFFNDSKDRNYLFGTVSSMNRLEHEKVFAQVPLKAFNIESSDQAEGFSRSGKDVLGKLQWLEAKVLNENPEARDLEAAPTVMSESLRIACRHSAGIITDRMNLGMFLSAIQHG